MVRVEQRGVELRSIQAAARLRGANEAVVQKFYSVFSFPAVDVYTGRWTEFEDFLKERGLDLAYKEGLLLGVTASLHYVKDGKQYVGYLADEQGQGRLLLKSDNLELA